MSYIHRFDDGNYWKYIYISPNLIILQCHVSEVRETEHMHLFQIHTRQVIGTHPMTSTGQVDRKRIVSSISSMTVREIGPLRFLQSQGRVVSGITTMTLSKHLHDFGPVPKIPIA